jgi:basic amino acid/polyamine antiporter, APA family
MLKRSIGKWDLVLLMINGIVGAGIFGLPSKVFRLSGVYSLFALGICALIVFSIILCFAEVSSRFDKTGGPYIYTLTAFGRFPAFLMGWLLELARIVTFAALINLLVTYLSVFSPVFNNETVRIVVMSALVGALTFINHIGVTSSTRVNNILTVSKLLPLMAFIVVGLFYVQPDLLQRSNAVTPSALSSTVLLWVFAFGGFESVIVNSGEMKEPGKTLPFALISSIIIIAIIYFLVQLVTIGVLPGLADSEKPVAEAAAVFMGDWGSYFIAAGAVISITGTLNAIMLIGSRLPFALSIEKQLPAYFSFVHPRFRTPTWSLLFFSAITLFVSIRGSFLQNLTISVIGRVVIFLFVCAALIALRRKSGLPTVFKIRYGYTVAILAIVFSLWLLLNTKMQEVRDLSLCMIAGALFYLLYHQYKRWRT